MIIGSNTLFFKNLPSTNTRAAELQRKCKTGEGTIVFTNHQSAGRGHAGNNWESEDGKNLLISIILYPSFIKPEEQFLLSMVISLGIGDFLTRYIHDYSIKWPNDIYVNNDKIAGILIESVLTNNQIDYSIAGIGLNINQEEFLSDAPNPTSLRLLTGINYDLSECLSHLGSDLDRRYKKLITGLSADIKNEYISKLYRLREWHKFRDNNGIFTGRIIDINDSCRIVIEKENSRTGMYSFKELEFIP